MVQKNKSFYKGSMPKKYHVFVYSLFFMKKRKGVLLKKEGWINAWDIIAYS